MQLNRARHSLSHVAHQSVTFFILSSTTGGAPLLPPRFAPTTRQFHQKSRDNTASQPTFYPGVVVLVDQERLDHHEDLVDVGADQVVQLVQDAVDHLGTGGKGRRPPGLWRGLAFGVGVRDGLLALGWIVRKALSVEASTGLALRFATSCAPNLPPPSLLEMKQAEMQEPNTAPTRLVKDFHAPPPPPARPRPGPPPEPRELASLSS